MCRSTGGLQHTQLVVVYEAWALVLSLVLVLWQCVQGDGEKLFCYLDPQAALQQIFSEQTYIQTVEQLRLVTHTHCTIAGFLPFPCCVSNAVQSLSHNQQSFTHTCSSVGLLVWFTNWKDAT